MTKQRLSSQAENSVVHDSAISKKILEWLAFLAVAFLGFGSSFYWIKVAVSEINPILLVACRASISAVFLFFIVFILSIPLPSGKKSLKALMAGIFGGALPNFLVSSAIVHVDTALAGILIGLTPIMTIIISTIFLSDQRVVTLSFSSICGLMLGFIGILTIFFDGIFKLTESTFLFQKLYLLLAAICYSGFGVFAKVNFPKEHPISLAALSSTGSALTMWVIMFYYNIPMSGLQITQNAVIALLWVGIITSGCSQVLVYFLIKKWGPSKFSTISYFAPLVSVVLGTMLLGEVLTLDVIVGGALILASIYIVNK